MSEKGSFGTWVNEHKNGIVFIAVLGMVFGLALASMSLFGGWAFLKVVIAIETIVFAIVFFASNPFKLGTALALLILILLIALGIGVGFGSSAMKLINRVTNPAVKLNDVPGASGQSADFGYEKLSEGFQVHNSDYPDALLAQGVINPAIHSEFKNIHDDINTLAGVVARGFEKADRNNMVTYGAINDDRKKIAETDARVTKVDKNVEKVADTVNKVASGEIVTPVSASVGSDTAGPTVTGTFSATTVPGGVYYRLPDNYMSGEAYEVVLYGRFWKGGPDGSPTVLPITAADTKVVGGYPYVAISGLRQRDYFQLRTVKEYFGSQWYFVTGHYGVYQSTNGKVNVGGKLVTFKKGNTPGGTSGCYINGEIYAFRDMQTGYVPENLDDRTIVCTNPL